MNTHDRLRKFMIDRDWTEYRLAKQSGLSESTIANIFRRNAVPSVSTLEAICTGFGITLSQFFSDGDMVELSPDLRELFDGWVSLSQTQKQAILQIIKAMNEK